MSCQKLPSHFDDDRRENTVGKEAGEDLSCEHPLTYFVFAMAILRAGVHEVARGGIGCKLGIAPLYMVGLSVGGTHDVRGGGAVVAAVRGGSRLAVGVRRPGRLPLVNHQVYRHLALEAADVAVAEVIA